MADKKLVELFLDLAGTDGMSGNEKEIADKIKSFLSRLGLSPEEDDAGKKTGGNSGNIICRFGSGGDFALMAHMDSARPTKDLRPVITADRITSSGDTQLGADDRAGIAAVLYAAERAITGKLPVRDFTIAFTVQEETTMGGSRNLSLGPAVKYGFIFDSSMRPGRFVTAAPGAAVFKASIKGKPSHAGVAPEKGISAILRAAKALTNLPLGRITDKTTANAGTIRGGGATNVVPASAEIEGEIRSSDMKEIEQYLEIFTSVFKEAAAHYGGSCDFTYKWEFRPFTLPPDCPAAMRAAAAVSAAGLKPEPVSSHGGSDANFLNTAGVQSVNFGIGSQNPHADDEFIMLADLQSASDIALSLIKK